MMLYLLEGKIFTFQTKRISGAGKMQAKFEKYQKNAYVV